MYMQVCLLRAVRSFHPDDKFDAEKRWFLAGLFGAWTAFNHYVYQDSLLISGVNGLPFASFITAAASTATNSTPTNNSLYSH